MNYHQTANDAHSEGCDAKSMTFARFYSMDDVFAFRRLLLIHNMMSLSLKKKEQFSTALSCKKITSAPDLAQHTYWSIGHPQVSAEFFADTTFAFNSCSDMCFQMVLVSGHIVELRDINCATLQFITCRNSSGNSMNWKVNKNMTSIESYDTKTLSLPELR